MPRRNRPKGSKPVDDDRPLSGALPVPAPPGWQARESRKEKDYRCPGCERPIPNGSAHVVAWRADRADERRHWHRPCWQTFTRTGR